MKNYFFILVLLLTFAFKAEAQDPHFSQFYAASLKLNPALTGAFNGRYRVSAIYRDQWRQSLDNQFSTYGVSTDLRFDLGRVRRPYADKAAVGVSFVSDRMGEFDYAYNQLSVSGAFHKALDANNVSYLSLGMEISTNQKTLNYATLSFSDQFNGSTGYTLGTNEALPENNIAYFDYAVGVNFITNPNRKLSLFAGAAIHHVFSPSISFYKFDDEEEVDPYENFVPRRYSAQLSVRFGVTEKFQLMPRAIADLQGGSFKTDAGLNYRFLLGQYNGSALQLGTYIRVLNDADKPIVPEAAVIMVGFEYNNVLLGFSYDANIATLSSARRRGAFEISLAYLGEYENELVLCPKF